MYQPDAYNIPYSNHYPNHYPQSVATLPTPLSYFPFQQPLQVKTEPAPPEPPEPVVTPKVASKAIERLILLELQHAGFESAEKSAVNRLELEVSTCKLFELLEVELVYKFIQSSNSYFNGLMNMQISQIVLDPSLLMS